MHSKRTHPPAVTPNRRMPMLNRCNAIKHVDYEDGETSSSARNGDATVELSSSSPVAGDGGDRQSHTLDLYSNSPSASTILYSSQTSFRIGGNEGELDLLCRSLGLSGPEDFAIPASVWKARKSREDLLSPSSSLSKLAADPTTPSPPPDKEKLEGIELPAGTRGTDDDPNENLSPIANSVRRHRAIKNVRPPPEITRSLLSDSSIALHPPLTVAALSPLPPIGKWGETGNGIESQNSTSTFPLPSTPENTTHADMPYLASASSNLSLPPAMWHPRQDDDVKSIINSFASDDDDETTTWRRIPDFSEEEYQQSAEDGSSSEIDEFEDKVTELRGGETGRELQDSSSRRINRNTTMPVMTISPNASFRRSINSWIRGDHLGSGSFGTVYEAISDDGFFFAVKEVSLLDQGSNAKQCIVQLEQEIALLSRFEHENIVQYFGTDKEESKLYIFLELVTQGSLASLYQKYHLRDSQVSAYTRQILNGLNYLHNQNVVHRDIKCANMLVDAKGSVKLADFGLAKETSKLSMLKSCKGSVYWMAPEVAKAKPYGASADIWSLGCTVLEMLTRKLPYPYGEWTQALFKIGRGERPPIPSSLSTDARDFIDQCVQVNPNERPSAAQLLNHPFVTRSLSGSLGFVRE